MIETLQAAYILQTVKNNIIGSIEDGSLKKKILKIISPHFSVEKTDKHKKVNKKSTKN